MTIVRQLSDNWSSEDDIFCDIWAGSKEWGGSRRAAWGELRRQELRSNGAGA